MRRFILFLIRRRLGLRYGECFKFSNQKTSNVYSIDKYCVWRSSVSDGELSIGPSNVSINWLLDPSCKITKVEVKL